MKTDEDICVEEFFPANSHLQKPHIIAYPENGMFTWSMTEKYNKKDVLMSTFVIFFRYLIDYHDMIILQTLIYKNQDVSRKMLYRVSNKSTLHPKDQNLNNVNLSI